ncbi:hypothetical protein M427DRAFT_32314 [Gonapodya prolifera JEL478]|uniref:Uncharacterized protein n=1 Tax=Gonapodya prolifera (strain JEL478) TaxID=1344416 RepID=A0A139AGR4_GONPJ|nr:hypothetical protein M427DRAFT_32314 [Gonapodya prolifera JEL478]|eukprot:KXS15635.1 hypothetical protein M427DRAFT_32314 [Gonapodya prolifera JEL478]
MARVHAMKEGAALVLIFAILMVFVFASIATAAPLSAPALEARDKDHYGGGPPQWGNPGGWQAPGHP